MSKIWNSIFEDILEPVSYLPLGFIAGAVYLLYCRLLKKQSEKKGIIFLCIVYMTVLMYMAFFSREPGSRDGMNMELFETWGSTPDMHAYFIENIIMFIPFGFLFPFAFRIFRDERVCIITGFLFSVLLETLQFFAQRGYCQLDDVVTNTIGTVIGWAMYQTFSLMIRNEEYV